MRDGASQMGGDQKKIFTKFTPVPESDNLFGEARDIRGLLD